MENQQTFLGDAMARLIIKNAMTDTLLHIALKNASMWL